jgi:predicted nucleic acid-binding protein
VTLEDPHVVSAAVSVFKRRPALGFSDCLLVEIARNAGNLPLATFDRGLAALPDVERL